MITLRQSNMFVGNDPSRCVSCGCDLVSNGGGSRAGKGMYQCAACQQVSTTAQDIATVAPGRAREALVVPTHSPAHASGLEDGSAIQRGYGVPWLLFGRLHAKQSALEVVQAAHDRYTEKHGKPPTACLVGDDSYPSLAALGYTVVQGILGMTLRVEGQLRNGQARVGRPGEAA